MSQLVPDPELLPSLRHLVRGLSVLFWGLPVTLVVCVQTMSGNLLRSLDVYPMVALTAFLLYGAWELGKFQKQERIWLKSLRRVKLLGLVMVGLSPFLFWTSRVPAEAFFQQMSLLFVLVAGFHLAELNLVLRRLAAMLPDETLRADVHSFTGINRVLLLCALFLAVAVMFLLRLTTLPRVLVIFLETAPVFLKPMLLLLVLLPLSLTMALLWKTRSTILDSIFSRKN